MPAKFTLPTSRQRVAIMGHTGCGKSQLAAFLLANAAIESMPWIIVDYKGEDLLNTIPYHQDITLKETPTKPGVYIAHPRPKVDQDAVEDMLWRIWERGNTGVLVDEAYTMPDAGAYQTLLVQGRSKKIPMINITQKPSWVPSQIFSESDYYSIFALNDRRDQKRANEFMRVDLERAIPEYHSHWYRVKDRAKFLLRPVPPADTILEQFATRLAPKRRMV